MKIISKLAIISIFVFANAMQVSINKEYINELLNYKVTLPNEIYNPFMLRDIQKPKKTIQKKKAIQKMVFLEKRLYLLAILNNKVLVKLEGTNMEKWLKVGDKIDEYTLKKIINNNSILVKTNNKIKIITMKSNKNINIKVEK